MLFLVAKKQLQPQKLRYKGRIYALIAPPPIPGAEKDEELTTKDLVEDYNKLPLEGLDRVRWSVSKSFKDKKQGDILVERHGLTTLTGKLAWQGKMVGPEIKLNVAWTYTLDPKTGKYRITHADLERGSTHELVDEHGDPTPLKAALFMIRHALRDQSPFVAPPSLAQRYASARVDYIKVNGFLYRREEG